MMDHQVVWRDGVGGAVLKTGNILDLRDWLVIQGDHCSESAGVIWSIKRLGGPVLFHQEGRIIAITKERK